jgi:type II secretory pathway pseudopilin PulG
VVDLVLKRKANILIESIVSFVIIIFMCVSIAPLASKMALKRQDNIKRILSIKAVRNNLYLTKKNIFLVDNYLISIYEKKR